MRRMRVTVVLLFAVLFVGTAAVDSALAQRPNGPNRPDVGVRAERNLNYLIDELDLTESQVEPVRSILAEHRDAAAEWFRANRSATRAERLAFHQEHRAALEAELGSVLNEDQMQSFKETLPVYARMGRAAFGRGADERGRAAGLRGGAGMAQWLDLTDEQTEQLTSFRTQHREALRTWLAENPDATRAERLAFMEQHRTARDAALGSILTEQQLEELDSLRSTRPQRPMRGDRPRSNRGSWRN